MLDPVVCGGLREVPDPEIARDALLALRALLDARPLCKGPQSGSSGSLLPAQGDRNEPQSALSAAPDVTAAELGSARQTTLWYWDEELLLPHVVPGTAGREIAWRRPTAHRVNQLLKNPCYAGAFA